MGRPLWIDDTGPETHWYRIYCEECTFTIRKSLKHRIHMYVDSHMGLTKHTKIKVELIL